MRVWEAATGKELAALKGHEGVRVWDVGARKEAIALKGHTEDVWGVAFSPDGNMLATGSWDGSVKVWDMSRGP